MKRILAAALILAVAPAFAGDHSVPPVRDALTRKECGECHLAFQPALLPAESWRRMMANLSDHFGDNATLPPDKAKAIEAYLVANARNGWRDSAAAARITETRWFVHEHRKIPERVWTRPDILTLSNCAACHKGAEQGLYDDD